MDTVGNIKIDKYCNSLIEIGYELLEENELLDACDKWFEAWQNIKNIIPKEINRIDDTLAFKKNGEVIPNWVQDFSMELGNAGIKKPIYLQMLIDVCNEILKMFPNSDRTFIHSIKRSKAEAYFTLKDQKQGDKCFQELVDNYSDIIWSFVGWGDMYLYPSKLRSIKDINKAEMLYKMAKPKEQFEFEVIKQRLKDVEKERSLTTPCVNIDYA